MKKQSPSQASCRGARFSRDPAFHRPFRTPQSALDDLGRRIAATRWPEKETVADDSQGVQLATMQKLASYSTEPTESKSPAMTGSFAALPQTLGPIPFFQFRLSR